MRFDSSEIGQSLTEIVAYGTGVVIGAKQAHLMAVVWVLVVLVFVVVIVASFFVKRHAESARRGRGLGLGPARRFAIRRPTGRCGSGSTRPAPVTTWPKASSPASPDAELRRLCENLP